MTGERGYPKASHFASRIPLPVSRTSLGDFVGFEFGEPGQNGDRGIEGDPIV
jgi:hypothetical protein